MSKPHNAYGQDYSSLPSLEVCTLTTYSQGSLSEAGTQRVRSRFGSRVETRAMWCIRNWSLETGAGAWKQGVVRRMDPWETMMTSMVDCVLRREHPWPNHDNVHGRSVFRIDHPWPNHDNVHGPTHSERRACMAQPWQHPCSSA